MLVLTVAKGPDRGAKFELRGKNSVIIGRNSSDLKLSDIMISRYHARLKEVDGRWYVRDLGSRNGTKLNGERLLRTHALREGDLIATGLTVLEFHVLPDPADNLAPVHGTDDDAPIVQDNEDESIAMAELPRVANRPAAPLDTDRPAGPPVSKPVADEAPDAPIASTAAPIELSDAVSQHDEPAEPAAALPSPSAVAEDEAVTSDWQATVDSQAALAAEEDAIEQSATRADVGVSDAAPVVLDVPAGEAMAMSPAGSMNEPSQLQIESPASHEAPTTASSPAAEDVDHEAAVLADLPATIRESAPARVEAVSPPAPSAPAPDLPLENSPPPVAAIELADAGSAAEPPATEPLFLASIQPVSASDNASASSVMATIEVSMELPALQDLLHSDGAYYSDNATDMEAALPYEMSDAASPQPTASTAGASIDPRPVSAPVSESTAQASPDEPVVPVAVAPEPVAAEPAATLLVAAAPDASEFSVTSAGADVELPSLSTPAATSSEPVSANDVAAPPAPLETSVAIAPEQTTLDAGPASLDAPAPIDTQIDILTPAPVVPVHSTTSPSQASPGGEQAASEWFAAVESQFQVVEGQGWDVEPSDDDDLIGLSAIADPPDSALDSDARQRLYWDDDDHWTDDDDADISAATALGDLDLPGLDRLPWQSVDLGEAPAQAPVPVAALRSNRINDAGERIAARDFAAAEAMLRGLQEEFPTDPRSLEMLVMLLEFTGRRGDAGALIEARLRNFPRDTHVLQLASLYHERAMTGRSGDTLDASVGALFRSLSATTPAAVGSPLGAGSPASVVTAAGEGRHRAKSRRSAR